MLRFFISGPFFEHYQILNVEVEIFVGEMFACAANIEQITPSTVRRLSACLWSASNDGSFLQTRAFLQIAS